MLRKWFIGSVVCASLLGVKAIADDEVKFDQGVSTKKVVEQLDIKLDATSTAQKAPMTIKTYTVSSARKTHAMGLKIKKLPGASWVSFKAMSSAAIPNAFDLRQDLTQIEDQGMCGSCWAFSLTATHRDGHAVGGRDPGRLSQEWLVDNAKEADGCNGGYFDAAANLVTPKGQPLWKSCPYKSGSGQCAADMTPAASIKAWHMLGDEKNGPSVKDIEAYMTQSGRPISMAVAAGAGDWQGYSGGVYNGCAMAQMDHMINIVGWDNEGATFDENGNLPPGKGIWILRNSWGTSWGEEGYMLSKMTDAKGQRCNSVAGLAAYFDF